MYLCLPPSDVCLVAPISSLNETWLYNKINESGLIIPRERQAFNYVSLCRKHHTGPLCSICEGEGYIKVNGHCEYCATSEASTATLLFVLGVIAGACVFFKVILGWRGKTAKTLYRVTPEAMYTGAVRVRKAYDAREAAGRVPRPTLGPQAGSDRVQNEEQANTCLGGHMAAGGR
jgi:hypothetical protein